MENTQKKAGAGGVFRRLFSLSGRFLHYVEDEAAISLLTSSSSGVTKIVLF